MNIKYILIIIIILIILKLYFKNCKNTTEKFTNEQIIQKNIFQTAWTKDLPIMYKELTDKLKNDNPEYNYYLYDDNDMDNFIIKNYPKYWTTYNMIAPEYIVAKADYFRYMVIYHYGGVYFDLKSGSKVPLKDIIKPNDEMIVVKWRFNNNIKAHIIDKAINWCIIAKQGHPVLKLVLDTIHNKILNYNVKIDGVGKPGVLKLTGPKLFEKVIYDNKDKYNITFYDNLIDNKLVYNFLDTSIFDKYSCSIYNITKGILGKCTHTAKKKKYSLLRTPIVKKI